MMISMMNYRGEEYGNYNNTGNVSMAQALDAFFCDYGPSEADMNEAVSGMLNKTVKPDYNYIFYAMSGSKTVHAYNRQADVCAGYLPVVSFEVRTSCNATVEQQPLLGIWPSWRVLPRKSEPPCSE